MRYSAEERRAIARGEFFTEAELAARPGLGKSVLRSLPSGQTRVDPNTRSVSAEVRKAAESNGVCSFCWEPGDDRSEIVLQADHSFRHPECQEALDAEREMEAE